MWRPLEVQAFHSGPAKNKYNQPEQSRKRSWFKPLIIPPYPRQPWTLQKWGTCDRDSNYYRDITILCFLQKISFCDRVDPILSDLIRKSWSQTEWEALQSTWGAIVHLMKQISNPSPWIHISQGTHHPNPDPGQESHKLLVLLAGRPSVVEHHQPPRTGLVLSHKQTFADSWWLNMIIARDRRLLNCNHNFW